MCTLRVGFSSCHPGPLGSLSLHPAPDPQSHHCPVTNSRTTPGPTWTLALGLGAASEMQTWVLFKQNCPTHRWLYPGPPKNFH